MIIAYFEYEVSYEEGYVNCHQYLKCELARSPENEDVIVWHALNYVWRTPSQNDLIIKDANRSFNSIKSKNSAFIYCLYQEGDL